MSLGIFALAAVVLGTAYVNVLVNYHNMQRRGDVRGDVAVVRAAVLSEPTRERVEEGGEMPLRDGGRLRWEVTLSETEIADLFRVELALETQPAGATAAVRETENFLVLRPTWSDPETRERLRLATRERLARARDEE